MSKLNPLGTKTKTNKKIVRWKHLLFFYRLKSKFTIFKGTKNLFNPV